MKVFCSVTLSLFLSSFAARASTPLELYVAGKYDQAIAAGTSQNDAQGYVLAARAALAQEMMRDTPCMECLKRAEDYARHAIADDPRLAEGHIYLAASIGYQARIIGTIAARFKGYAEEAKKEIDDALADDPKDPWAWAALGGWNIEVVHGGGTTLARWLYGANVQTGIDDFEKSFMLAPTNLVLRYQYALALAAYDRDSNHEGIAAALTRAIADKPQTAYEVFAQARAHALLVALNGPEPRAFDRLVRHDQGYP